MELVKLLPKHRYSVNISLHILLVQKYWVLTESRIPRKPVLGSMNILKKPSLLFSYIVGSLFLRDLFFRLFGGLVFITCFIYSHEQNQLN